MPVLVTVVFKKRQEISIPENESWKIKSWVNLYLRYSGDKEFRIRQCDSDGNLVEQDGGFFSLSWKEFWKYYQPA